MKTGFILKNKKGKVPVQPLTPGSDNHPPPLAPALPPLGAGAHAIPLLLPEIPIQVILHYRKHGTITEGRSPLNVSVFRSKADTFFPPGSGHAIFIIFHSDNPSWIQGLK
jgi:hypothetical protein